MAVTRAVGAPGLDGVLDVCPGQCLASFQIRFDPDRIAPHVLLDAVQSAEAQAVAERTLHTRIIEIPVLYNDPWTHETLMRFRDRHQDPSGTDLEYAARINGLADVDAFIAAQWRAVVVDGRLCRGLAVRIPMVERARQLQVPKYLRPRTDTPKLTQQAASGCFRLHLLGTRQRLSDVRRNPAPIYDPAQQLAYQEHMVFFRPGDIVQFKPIDHFNCEPQPSPRWTLGGVSTCASARWNFPSMRFSPTPSATRKPTAELA